MENLFVSLHKWAHRQDENFVTQAFIFLINHLLDHEETVGSELVKWLCFGSTVPPSSIDGRPSVTGQFRTEVGIPDIKIEYNRVFCLIEVKKGSRLGHDQLERYRIIAGRTSAAVRCRSRSETEPLSRPELSHRGGCELEFSCNFPLNPASTSPAHLAASLRAWLGLLYPGDLAVELLAKGNGCLEETQSCH